jgi:hypothetical protein
MDLFGNPIGSLTSSAFFRAWLLQKARPAKMRFYKEVVQKLKFPNNYNIFLTKKGETKWL